MDLDILMDISDMRMKGKFSRKIETARNSQMLIMYDQ